MGVCSAIQTSTAGGRSWGMVSMSEAIRRVLNSEHYDGRRTPGAAKSWLRRLAGQAAESGLASKDEAGRWWIHPSAHPALALAAVESRRADRLLAASESRRARALAKAQLVRDWFSYQRGPGRLMREVDARRSFTASRGGAYSFRAGERRVVRRFSASSLRRWADAYLADGVDSLADESWGGRRGRTISQAAIDMYWARRLDARKFSIVACHRLVAQEAKDRRWRWFESYEACLKWDRQTRDQRQLVLCREGNQAYTQQCGQYIELDPESYAPGECHVGDDHTFNVWVKLANGKVARPVLSAWQDWRSRKVVGFRVVFSGSEDSLLLAFRDAAESDGLPRVVIADNGKNFTSWQWTGGAPRRHVYRQAGELAEQVGGIFALCGIEPSWCLPYNPNGKARLERWFGTLDDQFSRLFPSYCGKAPEDRPDKHAALAAQAVDVDEFIAKLAVYVRTYNATPHSGEGMDGLTPDQVMSLAPCKRVLSDEVRTLLLASWRRPLKLGRNGVALRFAGMTVRYGAAEPSLRALAVGTPLRISYNPSDLSSVAVWTMNYEFLCHATMNKRLNRSVTSEELRDQMRAIAAEKRALRKARDIGLDYLRDPVDRALAAQTRAVAARRAPNPDGPDGGPLLVPVIPPLERVPARKLARKAAGAEGMEGMDFASRLDAFAKSESPRKVDPLTVDAMRRFNQKGGAK